MNSAILHGIGFILSVSLAVVIALVLIATGHLVITALDWLRSKVTRKESNHHGRPGSHD